MIFMQTAFTDEIDSPEIAASDILSQLRLDELCENTVAVIVAYWECTETGVLNAIVNALPCEAIGCTTLGSAAGFGYGPEQISVAVMTSDDVRFQTALSEPIITGGEEAAARSCYGMLKAVMQENPRVLFAFCPPENGHPCNVYAQTLDSASGGVPVFGTTANDSAVAFVNARVFCKGGIYDDRLALLALEGEVTPRFFNLGVESGMKQQICGTVTKTDGYRLLEINDMPSEDYFKSLGILTVDSISLTALPTLVDFKDGEIPLRIPIYVTDEGLISAQKLPVGSELAVSSFSYNDVMRTAESMTEQALRSIGKKSRAPVFIASSLSRCLMITPNNENELRLVADTMGERQPYIMIYTAGGICPDTGFGSNPRYTSLSFAIMVLE